jgi:hypothetical protein
MSQDSSMVIAIYGAMSLSLVGIGFYSLKKGFELIDRHQSNKEYSTIELGKLRVSLGSLGGLVMMTSFLWGYAATKIMPRYQDKDIIISVQKEVKANRQMLEKAVKCIDETKQITEDNQKVVEVIQQKLQTKKKKQPKAEESSQ